MICRICGEDINEKRQDNVSPIGGYPVCEDCRDDICCESCYSSADLYYCEDDDKIYCRDCVVELAEKRGIINSAKVFYTDDWHRICDDTDYEPIIEYLKEHYDMGLREVQRNDRKRKID